MSTKSFDDIPTLSLLYKAHYLEPAAATAPGATSRFNDKISLIRTDITKLETDAIVNAANESLLGGGGVDGAIHRAAGPELVRECETLDGCDTGSAKITNAYELPCKKVIHAVGPVYYSTKKLGLHTTLLQGCYRKSLDLAAQNDCKSIAFSALSTGVYGYPSDEAAETAIQAVKGWLQQDEERASKIERVVFCQFLEKDEDAYAYYIPIYFPPATSTADAEPTTEGQPAEEANVGQSKTVEPAEQAQALGGTDANSLLAAAVGEFPTEAAESIEAKIATLPDVPTTEPKQPGQPEIKKPKLDDSKV